MKNVILINASPKTTDKSLSKHMLTMLTNEFDITSTQPTLIEIRHSIKNHTTLDDFTKLSAADAIIIAFPLYFYCMPGILTRFLEDYYQFSKEQGKPSRNLKVYAIINCGFPEPKINLEAIRVISSFSRHVNAQFRFGILVGGGGMLLDTKDTPFMKKTIQSLEIAYRKIVNDIQRNELEKVDNIIIPIKFPKMFFKIAGSLNWIFLANKNGIKKKELYRQPYATNSKY